MIALYARVSTHEQNTAMQIDDLVRYAGSEKQLSFIDNDTGLSESRPGLDALMLELKKGVIKKLVVWRFDRLFRSTRHMLNFIAKLDDIGVEFVSMKEGVDTSTPMGKFMLTIFSAMAELELHTFKQRQKAGIAKAIKDGVKWGRRVEVNHQRILVLRKAGYSLSQIRKEMGCSRSTASRVIKSEKERVQKLVQISE